MEVRFNHEKFRRIRKEKHITQTRLAELSGTTDRYIRFMENGRKTNPSAILLYRASLVLEQPVEAFMIFAVEEGEHENG